MTSTGSPERARARARPGRRRATRRARTTCAPARRARRPEVPADSTTAGDEARADAGQALQHGVDVLVPENRCHDRVIVRREPLDEPAGRRLDCARRPGSPRAAARAAPGARHPSSAERSTGRTQELLGGRRGETVGTSLLDEARRPRPPRSPLPPLGLSERRRCSRGARRRASRRRSPHASSRAPRCARARRS